MKRVLLRFIDDVLILQNFFTLFSSDFITCRSILCSLVDANKPVLFTKKNLKQKFLLSNLVNHYFPINSQRCKFLVAA